jgi:hypothetical protein
MSDLEFERLGNFGGTYGLKRSAGREVIQRTGLPWRGCPNCSQPGNLSDQLSIVVCDNPASQ